MILLRIVCRYVEDNVWNKCWKVAIGCVCVCVCGMVWGRCVWGREDVGRRCGLVMQYNCKEDVVRRV